MKISRLVLGVLALMGLAGYAVAAAPTDIFSGDLARLFIACGSALVALLITHQVTARSRPERLAFRSGMVLWWFLLCSEAFFARHNNGLDNAASGRFATSAYAEGVYWAFLALCLFILAVRHWHELKSSLRGRTAFMFIVPLLCMASVAWAPEKSFSLAWSFKLLLGVATIAFCMATLRTLRDLRSFLIVTFWAFTFLTVVPVIEGTLEPSEAFSGTTLGGEENVEQGRFHATAHPLTIAGRAGIMALLALLFYSLERKRRMLAVALACAAIIGITGAKTAFLAAAVSVGLFFALRKRVMVGFAMVAAIGLLAFVIVSTTAVGAYVQDYLHKGELATISGRTDLWTAAMPEIESHLILGHGYVASKLVSMVVGIRWYAGHMHNAILETTYNNGLLGLSLLLAINFFIASDLIFLYRHAKRREVHLVAMSLLTLYTFIFLNGITESYFGGQASAFYLLFLALFGVSEWLRAYSAALARQTSEIPLRRARPMVAQAYRQA